MPQQTNFQILIAMNGHRDSIFSALFHIDLVAAANLLEYPAFVFQNLAEFFARNGSHTAISSMRSPFAELTGATSTDKQPSMASYRFVKSSSKVSPCVAQPGIAGTSAQKPPSSASCTTTLSFMAQDRFGRLYPSSQNAPHRPGENGSDGFTRRRGERGVK